MIRHHPGDELLLACAAGTLAAGEAIVLGAHLEGCAQCRASVRLFEAAGGTMLEAIEPALMLPGGVGQHARNHRSNPRAGGTSCQGAAAPAEPATRREMAAQPRALRRIALALDGTGDALEPDPSAP
jgi:anti-sigma factor RsiW